MKTKGGCGARVWRGGPGGGPGAVVRAEHRGRRVPGEHRQDGQQEHQRQQEPAARQEPAHQPHRARLHRQGQEELGPAAGGGRGGRGRPGCTGGVVDF